MFKILVLSNMDFIKCKFLSNPGYWLLVIQVMACRITHWGRVTHICVGNINIIGSDDGLAPSMRQAIILTNAEIFCWLDP